MGEWRSAALLGHPLTASGIVGAYVLALVLRPAICPPIPVRLPLIAFCLGSLMAFGGRTSLVTVLAAIGLVGAFEAFGIMRGKRTQLPATIVAICVLFAAAAVIFAALNLGIFDKMLLRFSSDKGSTLARYATFSLLSHFDWQELILGPNPVRANALQTQLGLSYGIENFWIACVVQFGIIHTVLLTIGLVCFFVELLRRSNRAVWAVVLLIVIIAASSVSFSSKNIQLAQFVILISLLLPRAQRRVAAPAYALRATSGNQIRYEPWEKTCMTIYIDNTHLGRHVTGLERITLELFSADALAPLDIVPVTAHGIRQMLTTQNLSLPIRLAAPSSVLVCPGFPPSPMLRPFASRVLPYIHDDFLITRRAELNTKARLYMAGPFKLALRHYPRFLANSNDTRRKLAAYCRADAEVTLYRPPVRNVFGLEPEARAERDSHPQPLRLVALGTLEPRKNFLAAANILSALRAQGFPGATLDIIGRQGWGNDWQMFETMPGVALHGYQPGYRVKQLLRRADLFVCTSHDEGLGLPLLEAQYGGLPIVAPEASVFREVLGDSGIYIDAADPVSAASQIAAILSTRGWRARYVALAEQNLARWNAMADRDRDVVIDLIAGLAA